MAEDNGWARKRVKEARAMGTARRHWVCCASVDNVDVQDGCQALEDGPILVYHQKIYPLLVVLHIIHTKNIHICFFVCSTITKARLLH